MSGLSDAYTTQPGLQFRKAIITDGPTGIWLAMQAEE
jgi:hypothetical protein